MSSHHDHGSQPAQAEVSEMEEMMEEETKVYEPCQLDPVINSQHETGEETSASESDDEADSVEVPAPGNTDNW